MDTIKSIKAWEILNAKGNPTVEVEMWTASGFSAVASAPAGTSTGTYEAFVLVDKEEPRYSGKGVRKAVSNVNNIIAPALIGHPVSSIKKIDEILLALDGTENKSHLGANAMLPVSVAFAKVRAKSLGIPLYASLTQRNAFKIPNIIATVIAGGEFSTSGLEFEDYLYVFHDFPHFENQLEALVALRARLEKELRKQYGNVPEDGGALAAPLKSSKEAFDIMLKVAEDCGFVGKVGLGLDVAASELYEKKARKYKVGTGNLSRNELLNYYLSLCKDYPLEYLEDSFDEDDADGFKLIKKFAPKIQNVGDDLFASNIKRLAKYHESANGLLLKINQIGSVSEAIEAAEYAQGKGMDITVSLRSGETADDFIADLSIAIGAKQIKLGSPVREERNVKYNRLLRISSELGA